MAKQYKGSLSLDWYNKQKSILLRTSDETKVVNDIPAPKVNWVNKEGALYYEINENEGKGVSPFWVDRNDIRVKEARPLLFQKSFFALPIDKKGSLPGMAIEYKIEEHATDDAAIENMIIKGDNLLALNTLKKIFDNKPEEEKIKCIYIDPPYNTGQAFELYEDNLAHSEWLTLMRDRLVILYSLLRNDGVFFIQLDDIEVHYTKLLLDEIFGRDNFINMICYERSGTAGIGQGGFFVDTAEYILVYAKNKDIVSFNEVLENSPIDFEVMKRYNKVLASQGERILIEEFTSKSNGLPIKIYKHSNYEINSISLRDFENRESQIKNEFINNFELIFRTTNPQAENSFQTELISKMASGLYSVDYTPSRGKSKDKAVTTFYNNNEIFAWLKDTASIEDDIIVKKNKLSSVWLHKEIPKADLANEGGVDLKRSKKPEQLIFRIMELATNKGDVILDCFGGSGTTACVAHKMDRKWISIEVGRHADILFINRLLNVISGIDQTGISKRINWKGGGCFKYYHIGESIIKIKEDGSGDFNWSLGKEFIQESFLSTYDYIIDKSIDFQEGELFSDKQNQPLVGIQKIGTKKRVAVITLNEPNGVLETLSYEEMQLIYKTVKKKYSPEYINIFTNRGIEIAYDSKPDDLEVVKIPNAIFGELEK